MVRQAREGEDSLAAMEAFTRMAAKHEESQGERQAKVELLNETSFDRRRQLAVYKEDGSRGHHMNASFIGFLRHISGEGKSQSVKPKNSFAGLHSTGGASKAAGQGRQ